MEASLEEMKAQNTAFREHVTNELSHMIVDVQDLREDVKKLQGEMPALKSDVSNISKNAALIMTIFGLEISTVSIIIQVWKQSAINLYNTSILRRSLYNE